MSPMTKAGEQPTITQALKPCPNEHCSGEDIEVQYHCGVYYVECDKCCHQGAMAWNEAEAIAAWNTRTTSLAAQDGLVEALRKVRECRLPAREKVQTIHGIHDFGECWNVSGLTKLLPEIDAALSAIKGDKS